MSALYRVVLTALIAGALAGLLTAALQSVTTWPLIHEAERFETPHAGHDEGWEPEGLARPALSVLATVLAGVGFGLLLAGSFAISGADVDGRSGVLWGAAGFAIFSLAPALGLPPEPPGALAAALEARQLWWLLTVGCTAGGLWLIAFRRGWAAIGAAVVLIALPHLIGAPRAEGDSTVPAELAAKFVAASLASTAVFWALLGCATGAVYERVMKRA